MLCAMLSYVPATLFFELSDYFAAIIMAGRTLTGIYCLQGRAKSIDDDTGLEQVSLLCSGFFGDNEAVSLCFEFQACHHRFLYFFALVVFQRRAAFDHHFNPPYCKTA